MNISDKGITVKEHYEGLRLKAYRCTSNKLTIGLGHTRGVKEGDVITKEKAYELFREDCKEVEGQLNRLKLNLNQDQFDAVADLIFNIGIGQFLTSTILRFIKDGETPYNIEYAFRMWVYSNGKKENGLRYRRKTDAELYNTGKVIFYNKHNYTE